MVVVQQSDCLLDQSVKPAGDNLELVKLEPEDSPTVLDQGADAQRARRRPGGKGHEVFKKDGDHTIKLTRRMKIWQLFRKHVN